MKKLQQRLYQYLLLTRFHRPVGIYLLLWPTLWALWIAGSGQPRTAVLLIFIIGTVVTRAAGCIINDIADRRFDAHVTRTRDRPLPSGRVSLAEAILLFFILSLIAITLVLSLNWLTIGLAVIAAGLIFIYPLMKRFIQLPQMVLGLAFAWGVPMAFAAQTGRLPPISILVFLIAYLWILVYDTFYAMADRADDILIGIKSSAILFGERERLITALLQFTMLILLLWLGVLLSLKIWYYFSILIVAVLALYQQYLIKDRQPEKCLQAFLNNQWLGLVIFAGLFLSYLP